MRRIVPFVLSGFLLATACGGGEEAGTPTLSGPTETAATAVTYTIDLNASPVDNAAIDVVGSTNLPEGSVLRVSASRANHWEGEVDTRAANIGEEFVTVTNGAFTASLQIDESNMVLLVGYGDVIDTLSDSVKVCAEFQTGEDLDGEQRQPPSVVDVVGPYGEQLAGSPQVFVFGSLTANPSNWLEAETTINLEPLVIEEIADAQGQTPQVGVLEGFCL